jgi:hypothetical protein
MRPTLVPGFLSPELPSVRGPSFVGRILIAFVRALPVRDALEHSRYCEQVLRRDVSNGLSGTAKSIHVEMMARHFPRLRFVGADRSSS